MLLRRKRVRHLLFRKTSFNVPTVSPPPVREGSSVEEPEPDFVLESEPKLKPYFGSGARNSPVGARNGVPEEGMWPSTAPLP